MIGSFLDSFCDRPFWSTHTIPKSQNFVRQQALLGKVMEALILRKDMHVRKQIYIIFTK